MEIEKNIYHKVSSKNEFSQFMANQLVQVNELENSTQDYNRRLDYVNVLGLNRISSSIFSCQNPKNNISFIESIEKLVQIVTITTNSKYDLNIDDSILHTKFSYKVKREILKSILLKCVSYKSKEITYITICKSGHFAEVMIESPIEELEEKLIFRI